MMTLRRACARWRAGKLLPDLNVEGCCANLISSMGVELNHGVFDG
jgi:hypothetical protein